MSEAGPISTITIAASSFVGVIFGGILSDRWVRRNLRGRIYTGAIGLALTVPSLLLLGYSHSFVGVVGAGLLFGVGYGMFDANNMPILCQFVPSRYRGTAYGSDEHDWRLCRGCRDDGFGLMGRRRDARFRFCPAGLCGSAGTCRTALLPPSENR